jgi:hypothetical protein
MQLTPLRDVSHHLDYQRSIRTVTTVQRIEVVISKYCGGHHLAHFVSRMDLLNCAVFLLHLRTDTAAYDFRFS